MNRCISPLIALTLASLASAQPRDYDPTPDEIRLADRLAANWELEDERTLEHRRVDGPHGTFEAFRGEFPEDTIVIEWLRFESRQAALQSLDLLRAAPNAVKVAAVFGKQIYTIEVREAELTDRYALSGSDAAEAIRLLRNDEREDGTGWLRVKSPQGAFGYVPGAEVDIDTSTSRSRRPSS